jgi:polar amino acid transport system substrate-binding protein
MSQTNEKKTFVLNGSYDHPPYEYLEQGKPAGFNIDLIKEIARVMNFNIDTRLVPLSKTIENLTNSKVDILSGIAYSAERDKVFDFAIPHGIIAFDLFVRKGSPVRSLNDLKGKTVAVQEDFSMYDYAKELHPVENIVTSSNGADIIRLLSAGRYDAVLMNKMQGLFYIRTLGLSNLEALGIKDLPQKNYGFAVAEGNNELRGSRRRHAHIEEHRKVQRNL